jgi:hypothetical protein
VISFDLESVFPQPLKPCPIHRSAPEELQTKPYGGFGAGIPFATEPHLYKRGTRLASKRQAAPAGDPLTEGPDD